MTEIRTEMELWAEAQGIDAKCAGIFPGFGPKNGRGEFSRTLSQRSFEAEE
jgi:hypothetical protein